MSSLSQYTGSGLGLPMEDSRTPPVAACLQISSTVVTVPVGVFPEGVCRFSRSSARGWGRSATHRWQSTHPLSSAQHNAVACHPSGEPRWRHCFSQMRQSMQRCGSRIDLKFRRDIELHPSVRTLLHPDDHRFAAHRRPDVFRVRLHHPDGGFLAGNEHLVVLFRHHHTTAASAGRSAPSGRRRSLK